MEREAGSSGREGDTPLPERLRHFLRPPLPRRIAVIGSGGAGKSTLARELGPALGLPVVHLDREFWHPGWVESTRDAFDLRHAALIAGDAWVIEGNFQRTLHRRAERAEGIVLLDYPRRVCLAGAIRRVLRFRGEVRPDMGEGCPEKFDLAFLHWLWRFPKDTMPLVRADLDAYAARGGRTLVLRTRRETADFLAAARLAGVTP